MKILAQLLLLLAFSSLSVTAQADFFDNFQPQEDDLSVAYLSMMLGETGGPDPLDAPVLGQVSFVGVMLATFNQAIIALAFIVLAYQVILSTYDTARSGRFLGEKGSFWLPVRAAFGIALLFPNGTSYCLAQALVLHVVYGGIGLGDALWQEAGDYLQNSGAAKVGSSFANAGNYSLDQFSSDILVKGATCLALLESLPDYESSDLGVELAVSGDNAMLRYGVLDDGVVTPATSCIRAESAMSIGMANAYKSASLALIPEVSAYLQSPVNADMTTALNAIMGSFVNEANAAACTIDESSEDKSKYIQYGWLTAGMYFRELLEPTKRLALCNDPPNAIANEQGKEGLLNISGNNAEILTQYTETVSVLNALLQEVVDASESDEDSSVDNDALESFKDEFNTSHGRSGVTFSINNDSYNPVNRYTRMFAGENGKNVFDLKKNEDGTIVLNDPFDNIVSKGKSLMETTLAVTMAVIFAITALNIMMMFNSGADALPYMMQQFSNITWIFVSVFFGLFYGLGTLFAVYLPMIPMLIFLVTAIGWFIFVFLALVGAPIIALGIVWPAKDDGFMGKATPAIMMLLNLLLRPGLMIVGLFAGVLVCSVGFFMIVAAFSIASETGIINPDNTVFAELPIGLAFAYTMVAVAQKSFMLISMVPDKVLTWIGGQMAMWDFNKNNSQMLSAARSASDQGAQMASDLTLKGKEVGDAALAPAITAAKMIAAAMGDPEAMSGDEMAETPEMPENNSDSSSRRSSSSSRPSERDSDSASSTTSSLTPPSQSSLSMGDSPNIIADYEDDDERESERDDDERDDDDSDSDNANGFEIHAAPESPDLPPQGMPIPPVSLLPSYDTEESEDETGYDADEEDDDDDFGDDLVEKPIAEASAVDAEPLAVMIDNFVSEVEQRLIDETNGQKIPPAEKQLIIERVTELQEQLVWMEQAAEISPEEQRELEAQQEKLDRINEIIIVNEVGDAPAPTVQPGPQGTTPNSEKKP